MIRKLVGVSLFLALLAPLIALDRAPLICVMGGVATVSEAGHAMPHHMVHGGIDSHSRTRGKSHGCICPWECGSSRAPADVVHALPGLSVTADSGPSPFGRSTPPVSGSHAFLPLATGPPRSLRS